MRYTPRVVKLKISPENVRSFPDPNGLGRKKLIVQISARQLFEANINFGPNPRKQNITGRVAKGIQDTLLHDPQWFLPFNKGVFLIVKDMSYDNKTQQLTLTFNVNAEDPEDSPHGNLDGGHTNRIIQELFQGGVWDYPTDPKEEPYVTVEIMQFTNSRTEDRLSEVVGARNSVVAVNDLSIIVCGDEVDWLRDLLKSANVADHFNWKQNEDDKELYGSDLIAILSLLNEEIKERHQCYSSPGRIISALRSRLTDSTQPNAMMAGLKKVAPKALDFFKFYDYVHQNFESWYVKSRPGPANFKNLSGVFNGRKALLAFLNITQDFTVNKGWLMPFVGAFAGEITANEDYATWCSLADKVGPKMVSMLVKATNDNMNNVNFTAKKGELWEALHEVVENAYLRSRLVKLSTK